MTWKEFKDKVELQGITDETEIIELESFGFCKNMNGDWVVD